MLRLKRGLKRARLFEIQKITRRVKLLEGKRGTEPQVQKNRRKARRLLEELEFIKNLNLSDIAGDVLETVSTEGNLVAVNTPSDLLESARWRLLNSNAFQQVVKHIRKEEVKGVRGDKHFPKSEGVGDGQTPFVGDWLLEQNGSGLVKQSDQLHKSLDNTNESVMNSEKQYSDSEHAIDEQKRRGTNTKRMEHDTKGAGGLTSSSERKKFLTSDSLPKHAASCLGDVRLDSVFLESLGKSQPQKKCQQPHPMKRRNRPGQRARQKGWELLYGSEAKHLKKKQNSKEMRPSNKVSRVVTRKPRGAGTDGKWSSDQLEAGSSLHPSWAAIRQKKAKEGGIKEFQGQRIVFSDSD